MPRLILTNSARARCRVGALALLRRLAAASYATEELSQRCHMIHNRQHYLSRRRIIYLLRCALGGLFFGSHSIFIKVLKIGLSEPLAFLQSAIGKLGWRFIAHEQFVQVQCALRYWGPLISDCSSLAA
jgi:hypothetical protein